MGTQRLDWNLPGGRSFDILCRASGKAAGGEWLALSLVPDAGHPAKKIVVTLFVEDTGKCLERRWQVTHVNESSKIKAFPNGSGTATVVSFWLSYHCAENGSHRIGLGES